jgi:hypothetical protein
MAEDTVSITAGDTAEALAWAGDLGVPGFGDKDF